MQQSPGRPSSGRLIALSLLDCDLLDDRPDSPTAISTAFLTALSKRAIRCSVKAARAFETAVRSSGRAVRGFKVLRRKAQTSRDERESRFSILQLATTILQPYYNPILQPHTTTSLPCSFVAKCNCHSFNNKNTYILLTRASKVAFCYKTAKKWGCSMGL